MAALAQDGVPPFEKGVLPLVALYQIEVSGEWRSHLELQGAWSPAVTLHLWPPFTAPGEMSERGVVTWSRPLSDTGRGVTLYQTDW